MRLPLWSRRTIVAAVGGILALVTRPVVALARVCRSSVAADDGPFYPAGEIPVANDLTRRTAGGPTAVGDRLLLFGLVRNADCRPVADATVEIWQADARGHYDHPRAGAPELDPGFRYFAKVTTDATGRYRFLTIRPAPYQFMGLRRAPHIHVKVRHPSLGGLTTEVYFAGADDDERRRGDRVFQNRGARRDEMVAPFVDPSGLPPAVQLPDGARACQCDFELAS